MVKSFSQKETLTTRIKGLLEEYPVGTGILKEALQNSDDAGARVQKFLLDHRTYPTANLIDPTLARYQGPALLLFNDSVFQDSDFQSLSNLGKSGKRSDALKTGKFGLGFNSCYNLTDAPMILSGNQLIILEPHEEITNRDLRGGLQLDITKDSVSENQLKPFKAFLGHGPTRFFNGTIIRLPLRTPSDAARSEISTSVITADNIIDLFESFKCEAIESLLFLKNIEKIEVYELVDKSLSVTSADFPATLLYSLEIGDSQKISGVESIRAERAKLIDALRKCTLQPQETRTSCTMTMVVSLKTSAEADPRKSSWLIHHTVDDMTESNIDKEFLRDEKLMAWVGLAAPLDFEQHISGRLFTFLPLPITTPFPVHIHGIFGLTRDRRNLISHSPDYPKGSRTDMIATWNQHLFQESIPSAWSRLLVELTEVFRHQRPLPYFPPVAANHPNAMWRDMLSQVLRRVVDNRLPVFSSILPSPRSQKLQSLSSPNSPKWASLNNTFVDDVDDSIIQILADSGMLLVRIPQDIRFTLIDKDMSFNSVTSSAARHHLKQTTTPWQKILEAKSKCKILDYLCEDNNLGDLVGLQLIPLASGQFSEFKPFNEKESKKLVYARMMNHELKLFSEWNNRIVGSTHLLQVFDNLDKFSILEKTTNVRRWSMNPAIDYIKQTYFGGCNNSEDEIEYSGISLKQLNDLWKWIDKQNDGFEPLDALWLLPMTSGKLRKVRTKHAVFSVKSTIRDTLTLTRLLERAGIPFLREDFECSPGGYLARSGLVKTIWDIVDVLDWFSDTACLVNIDIKEAAIIRAHLTRGLRSMPLQSKLSGRDLATLRKLPIYEFLLPANCQDTKASIVLQALSTRSMTDELIPVVSLDVVPKIDGTAFVDVSDSDSHYLLSEILKMKICTFDDFIKNILVPNLESQPEHLLDPLMKIVISNLLKVPEKQRNQHLRNLKFVQVSSSRDSNTSPCRRAPSELVDPKVEILTSLLLPDEEAYPTGYYKERGVINQLATLGMSTGLTSSFIKDRINCYVKAWRHAGSKSEETRLQIHSKAAKLLKAISLSEGIDYPSEIVGEQWLPAEVYSDSRKLTLARAIDCRDLQDAELASYSMPIVQYRVRNQSLRNMFKWDQELSVDILQKQMLGLLEDARVTNNIRLLLEKMMPVLEKLGKIAVRPERLASLKTELDRRAWIPLEGRLRMASHVVFQSPIANLQPYVFSLSLQLSNYAPKFFEFMGVAKSLNSNHLINILETMQKEALQTNDGVLNEMQIVLAVRIIEHLARDVGKEGSTLEHLYDRILIPDINGRLTELKKLTYNDMPIPTSQNGGDSKGNSLHLSSLQSLVNDLISPSVVKNLRIPLLSEQILATAMDNEDLFADHSQKEDMCTRIANTLRNYSMESISNEFLANADDSADATRLCWVFDLEGRYQGSRSKSSLLCPEMEEWQGPSLYCYNNGVFTEDDIRGLIRVGNGSKQDNIGKKIGKYGEGFMVAYHFTDVPSLVSGDSAVFLDPQQEFLPFNRKSPWERHAGIHLNMRRLGDSQFSDQFAPLKGLFGFDPNETFEGTLFRFPFRSTLKRADKSKFAFRSRLIDEEVAENLLEKLYEAAQRSLFFLRRIEKIEAFMLGSDRKLKPKWSVSLENLSTETKETRKGLTMHRGIFNLELRMIKHNLGGESKEKWIVLTDPVPNTKVTQRLVDFATQERVIPHVGIAARVAVNSKDGTPFLKAEESRLTCFLPMNISIGLPVHVHGCFALQQNRQSIRMGVPDARGNKNLETEWNEFLMQRIAKLYVQALPKIAAASGLKGDIYKYWPNPENTKTRSVDESFHNEFWQLLRSPNKNHCLFEMHTHPGDTVGPSLLSVQDAIFENANGVPLSSAIMNILKRCNYKVVRFPPVLLKKLLENPVPQHFKLITPSLVRKAIRDSSPILSMRNLKEQKQFADMLIYLVSDDNWEDLDGCQILPLLNNKMATFTLQKPDEEPAYYLPSEEESTLFEFASDQLVSVNLPKEVVDLLKLDTTRLNVGSLTPDAIRRILRQRISRKMMMDYNPKNVKVPNEAWITKFWKYWDAKMLSITELQDIPLLPIGNPPKALASVNHLDQLSCIQPPSSSHITQIIGKIGNIFILNPKALPSKSIQVQVFNLDSFLGCLDMASTTAKSSVVEHLRTTLIPGDLLVLRSFVIEQLKVTDIKSMEFSRKRVLSQLPIWNVWPNEDNHLATAAEACVLPDPKIFFYLIPSTGERFFREDMANISLLKHIDARTVSLQDYFRRHVVSNLPRSFSQAELVKYCEFLRALISSFEGQVHKNFRAEVSNAKLIPDRTGTLRCGSQVFDSTVELFRGTFSLNRHDLLPHSFAESRVPKLSRFLKHTVNSINFVACASEIESLYLNPSSIDQRTIQNQAAKVFQYLNNKIEEITFTDEEWRKLKAIQFIPASPPTIPFHGGVWHTKYDTDKVYPLLSCMNELVLPKYLKVAWTQLPIFHNGSVPSQSLREHDPTIGIPDAQSVVEHMVKLAEDISIECKPSLQISPLNERVLEYLEATYTFLDKHTNDAADLLKAYTDRPLFFNCDKASVDVSDRSLWHPASSLLLDILYDPSPSIHCVKQRLLPFKNLLRAAGARTIIDEFDDIEPNDDKELAPPKILEKIYMWYLDENEMSSKDVVFVVGREGDVLERIWAHRVILATSGQYFERLFMGKMREASKTNACEEIRYSDFNPQTFRHVLTYIYTGSLDNGVLEEFNPPNDEGKDLDLASEKAHELIKHLLGLLYAADMFLLDCLRGLVQREIVKRKLVRVETVVWLLEKAEKFHANWLAAHCRQFKEANSEVVAIVEE